MAEEGGCSGGPWYAPLPTWAGQEDVNHFNHGTNMQHF